MTEAATVCHGGCHRTSQEVQLASLLEAKKATETMLRRAEALLADGCGKTLSHDIRLRAYGYSLYYIRWQVRREAAAYGYMYTVAASITYGGSLHHIR